MFDSLCLEHPTADEGFTRAQAVEWPPYNIQVNAAAAGPSGGVS